MFKAYENYQYKEVMAILANLTPEQFQSMTLNDMTLLHHVAFDGNLDVIKMMTSLPYFRDIVDSDNNDVTISHVL